MQNRNKPYLRGDVVLIDMPLMRNSHVLGGVRPWVIVQNDLGNQFSPTSIVCPLTTQFKKMDMPTHIAIAWDKLLPSVVQCEQVRVVDVRDDWKYIVTLPPEIMEHIDAALRNAFFYKKDVGGGIDDEGRAYYLSLVYELSRRHGFGQLRPRRMCVVGRR